MIQNVLDFEGPRLNFEMKLTNINDVECVCMNKK